MAFPELEAARLRELNEAQRDWVEACVVVGCPDLRTWTKAVKPPSRDEVLKAFPKRRKKRAGPGKGKTRRQESPINDSQFVYTLVWQMSILVRANLEPPMRGDIRTFWYRCVEKVYNHYQLLDLPVGPDAMGLVLDNDLTPAQVRLLANPGGEGGTHGAYILALINHGFDDFVQMGIFTFRDPWDFQDTYAQMHRVGRKTHSIIFFTEKEGFWWFCKQVQAELDISVMASRGEPHYVTMENFASQLREHHDRVLRVCAFCDYDPWGLEIAENVKAKLELPVFGYPDGPFEVRLTYLTSPELFSAEELAEHRDLGTPSKEMKKRVDHWMDVTKKQNRNGKGGIDGNPWCVHIDNCDTDKVMAAVRKWVKQAKVEAQQDKRRAPVKARPGPGAASEASREAKVKAVAAPGQKRGRKKR